MDLHKWFFMSYDCSAILYKDPTTVQTLFEEKSKVVKELSIDSFASEQIFFNLGPELSRRARALPVYIAFKHYGIEKLGRNVLYQVEGAKYLSELVDQDPDFDLVTAPLLSILTFRMVPSGLRGKDDDQVDELNKYIRSELEKEGKFFMSPTNVRGRPVLRVCWVNHNARVENLEDLYQNIKKLGKEWMKLNFP